MHSHSSFVASAAIVTVLALAGCSHAQRVATAPQKDTITVVAPAAYTEHTYRGEPDLGLTQAIVQAGGGPHHFDSARLFRVLAGPNTKSESAKLQRIYGKAKMAAFMQTFDYAVRDLSQAFAINHITLPDQPRVSPQNGRAIASAIYQDGIMPSGKYDCGYMMEHLMTHPVHIVLMRDINLAQGHGPAHNANFHIVLTQMIADLHKKYGAGARSGRAST